MSAEVERYEEPPEDLTDHPMTVTDPDGTVRRFNMTAAELIEESLSDAGWYVPPVTSGFRTAAENAARSSHWHGPLGESLQDLQHAMENLLRGAG